LWIILLLCLPSKIQNSYLCLKFKMYPNLMQISVVKNDSIAQIMSGNGATSLQGFLNLPNVCLFLILILLLISLYIYAKKLSKIKSASKVDMNFMNRIRDYIHDGKIEAAHSLCKSMETPAGKLIDKGIGRIGTPVNDVYSAMESLGKIEGYKLGKGIQVLLSLVATVVILGILGSLFVFDAIAKSIPLKTMHSFSSGNPGYLLDVEVGLIAGLVIYLAYRQLISKLGCFSFSMQQITVDFMDLLNEPVK
jgi:biopolymer transport protein ExbB